MSKVVVDRHSEAALKQENKHSLKRNRQQENASLNGSESSVENPMLHMQAAAGNQAAVQMMQGSVPQVGRKQSGSSGENLPEQLKGKMEQSFGSDFSDVHIHKDSGAATSIGAEAYAQGNQVHFAPGKFSPDSQSGQALIGHELAHVVQQREGNVQMPPGKDSTINFDQSLEKSADDAGSRAAKGLQAEPSSSSSLADSAMSSMSSSYASTESAPIQGFFGKVLGGLKKAGGSFMESGGMDSLMGAGMSAGKALLGGEGFGGAMKAGAGSFMDSGGMGQLQGAGAAGISETGGQMSGGGGMEGLMGKGMGMLGGLLGGKKKKKK